MEIMENRKELIKLLAMVELARRKGGFWYFCRLMIPAVYNDKRPYLKKLCEDLENFWNDDTKKYFLLSIPPRHCKTLTIGLFVCYLLGLDYNTKIMTGSYNEDFSSILCKTIRNRIQEQKIDVDRIVYSDIYESKIERGSGQAHQFKLEGSNVINVLSTSINGKSTGFGANLIILDDMLKSASESYNIKTKEKIYEWFTDTLLSRLEGQKQKVIIIGTRWAKDDLIGRVLDWNDEKTIEVNLKAYDEKTDKMLCDEILNKAQFEELKKRLSEEIFMANYQGIPLDLKDKLYSNFQIYDNSDLLDEKGNKIEFNRRIAYIDTADTGSDSLVMVSIGWTNKYPNRLFILDIYMTKDTMEFTEKEVAKRIKEFNIDFCRIESNNGGRGFGRNVKRIYEEEMKEKSCMFKFFTQNKNKQSRLYTYRHDVQTILYYPRDWSILYPDYFKEMVEMKSQAQNPHDDAADATTGIIETTKIMSIIK